MNNTNFWLKISGKKETGKASRKQISNLAIIQEKNNQTFSLAISQQ